VKPVALFTHAACLAHDTGPYHPECPDRLRAVLRALEHPDFVPLLREQAPEATHGLLCLAHPASHVDRILALHPEEGSILALDPDTVVSAGTVPAALRAAGGAAAAVDSVMEGWASAAFVAARPPGHHAERARAMGFCFFNNAAVAARHARQRWGLSRVAIVDFDVHHGNGTEDIFASDSAVFYGSSHQHPCYPGTGSPREHGVANNIVNVQLPPGAGSERFRAAWADRIIPALEDWAPELLIVSAGFDAHRADPLAELRVETADFAWLTDRLLAVADAHAQGRVVSLLEGGYDLGALAEAAAAHVRRLMRI
jgi:acetoin utilization deacetylase AcuC-like enzyme